MKEKKRQSVYLKTTALLLVIQVHTHVVKLESYKL